MKSTIPKSIEAFLQRQEKAGRKFEKFQPRPYQWLTKAAPPKMDEYEDAVSAYEAAHQLSNLYGRMEVLAFEEGEAIPRLCLFRSLCHRGHIVHCHLLCTLASILTMVPDSWII